MSPDLTDLQLICLGIAIAIATTFTTILILTLVYAEEIRRHLQRLGLLRGRRIPRTDWGTVPFPAHYVVPCFEQRRTTIRTDLASVSTTTTTRSLHRRTITVWDPSSNKYYSSREDSPTRNNTLRIDARHCSPTPKLEDPGTLAWHIQGAQNRDPWGETTDVEPHNDPDYRAGSWNPRDRERALAQIEWDLPIPVLDNDDLQPEQIDASLPYFTREALAISRTRNGLHSPAYNVHDPFAALRQNYIPFPTTRRNQIPPVPFGQWPDESDTSDSSDEPDQVERRQRRPDANVPVAESVPRLNHSGTTDPFNVEGPDYEWNALAQID